MKKIILLCFALLLTSGVFSQATMQQPIINARVVNVLPINGQLFKDLNKNGKLDGY